MFQYAASYACAKRHDLPLRFDLGTFSNKNYVNPEGYLLDKVFSIEVAEASMTDKISVLGLSAPLLMLKNRISLDRFSSAYVLEEELFTPESKLRELPEKGIYMNGWWQTAKNFSEHDGLVAEKFHFNSSCLDPEYEALVRAAQSENSVSIHVRRGDYDTNKTYQEIYGTCSIDYYRGALANISKEVSSPSYYVVTDDPEWVRNESLFAGMPVISAANDQGSWNDMYFMSKCKHNIIANSTFSWWAAWLNSNPQKLIFCPKNWFADGTRTPDLIPADWIQL